MSDIADIKKRVTTAFSPPAQDEATVERIVHPLVSETEHPSGCLRRLSGWLGRWRSERPLAKLERDLKEARAESAEKSRLLATVAHEFRTPLNGVLGMAHLLGHTRLNAEQLNYVSAIRQSGHALAQLVEDLLDQSTIEAGRFKLNSRTESLRQVIESVVELLAPIAHEKRIEIAATVDADLPMLMDFDPGRIRQVLFNVIGNAVKFTAQGGVLISAFLEDAQVVIAVEDSGPGLTGEDQKRIFGEFEQAGTTQSRSAGTGLGLGIASRILAEFGGTLTVQSVFAQGTTFFIRFPLVPPQSRQPQARGRLLARSCVLLLAPHGPSARATLATIETLGGLCRHIAKADAVHDLIDRAAKGPRPFTDLIVDHRLASEYANGEAHASLHRILLVNPEERALTPQEYFDAWLIRPLREKSLIDVLSGRLRGFGSSPPLQMVDRPPALQPVEEERPGLDILLGEDDPANALLVRTWLAKAGHRVRHFSDFASLYEAATNRGDHFDILVTDMHMPGGDVFDLLESLDVKRAENNTLPVIVLTGEGREEELARLGKLGAERVLNKPVDRILFLKELEAVYHRRVDIQQFR